MEYDEFEPEYYSLAESVQDKIATHAKLLEEFGPNLGRPSVDTLAGSKYANMKELRFAASNGVWRVAFDTERRAILLVAGNKISTNQNVFYKTLIRTADRRFNEWLEK